MNLFWFILNISKLIMIELKKETKVLIILLILSRNAINNIKIY
jgi:hypothetical protein